MQGLILFHQYYGNSKLQQELNSFIFQIMSYYNYDMFEEDLLNQDQPRGYRGKHKAQMKDEIKLKNWVIYCKQRAKKSGQQQYSKNLTKIGDFSTIKQFFNYHSNIKQPSTLEMDTKLFYFLQGCKPFWQQWLESGCLLINIKYRDEQKDQLGVKIFNNTWQYLLFSMIGNNLPRPRKTFQKKVEQADKQQIIGLVLQRRQSLSLIQVWYRNQTNEKNLTKYLKEDIKNYLKLQSEDQKKSIKMRYKRHKDSIQTNSTIKGGYPLNFKVAGTASLDKL